MAPANRIRAGGLGTAVQNRHFRRSDSLPMSLDQNLMVPRDFRDVAGRPNVQYVLPRIETSQNITCDCGLDTIRKRR